MIVKEVKKGIMGMIYIGDPSRSFQERLRSLLNYRCKQGENGKKLTQDELIRKIGFENPETFKAYMKPEKHKPDGSIKPATLPNIDVYRKICDGLGVHYGFLLGEDIPISLWNSGLYGFLKNVKGLEICFNPENEDEIKLTLGKYSILTTQSKLTEELINYVVMMIIRENLLSENCMEELDEKL